MAATRRTYMCTGLLSIEDVYMREVVRQVRYTSESFSPALKHSLERTVFYQSRPPEAEEIEAEKSAERAQQVSLSPLFASCAPVSLSFVYVNC